MLMPTAVDSVNNDSDSFLAVEFLCTHFTTLPSTPLQVLTRNCSDNRQYASAVPVYTRMSSAMKIRIRNLVYWDLHFLK